MSTARSEREVSARDIVVTRVFDAPVSLVYAAWTDPRHVVHWWIPKEFLAPEILVMNVRVGGEWRIRMPLPDGTHCTAYGIYREVEKDRRLAWDDFCDDQDGKYFHKAFVSVAFEELDAKRTRVTLRARLEGVPGRDPKWTMEFMERGWAEGWGDNLAKLAAYLPGMR